jgi:hypothetical protein
MALRAGLREQHWSYMDRYATQLIACGPTFDSSGDTLTGRVHIVDLPGPDAARAFAFDEPGYQAGAYRDVLLRRWRNALGRTMWDFPGGRTGGNRYLVLGLGAGQAADLAVPPGGDQLIAYGPLLSDDGATWLGTAALVRAPDPATAGGILGTWEPAGAQTRAYSWPPTCSTWHLREPGRPPSWPPMPPSPGWSPTVSPWSPDVAPYQPGRFCLRELPPLRAVLDGLTSMGLLVVDGYVDLDPDGRPGLGACAHAAFAGKRHGL